MDGGVGEAGAPVVPKLNLSQLFDSDYLVILEFSARKLAFVFRDRTEADRFKMCMQILVRYVRPSRRNLININEAIIKWIYKALIIIIMCRLIVIDSQTAVRSYLL